MNLKLKREAEVQSGRTSSRCFHHAVPSVIGASRDEGNAVQGREESQKVGKRAGEEKTKNQYLLQVIGELEAKAKALERPALRRRQRSSSPGPYFTQDEAHCNLQVLKKAKELEKDLAEVQIRTWRFVTRITLSREVSNTKDICHYAVHRGGMSGFVQ